MILVLVFGCSVTFGAPPQKPQPQRNNQEEVAAPPGTIGDSGYVVPIPEIKMRSIIGGPPRKTPPPERPAAPESSEPARPEKQIDSPVSEGPVAVPPAEKLTPPPVTREKPAEATAAPKPQPPVERQREPVHIPESPQSAPAEPVESPSTSPESTRLPFEPSVRQPRESGPVRMPREVPHTEQRQEEKELDDEEAPPISTPQAPEEIMTAPAPKKEILKKRTEPLHVPALMENRPAKNPLTTIPIERMRVKEGDSESAISLDSRKEPETLPDPEPASTEPAHPEPPPIKQMEQLPAKQPEPSPVKQPEPPKESVPPSPAVQPEEQKETAPRETLPQPEEPVPAVVGKEEPIRSPLDSDAGNGREVREYLKKTAPILEEVSLLMTRAPSLSLADYDPSDPGVPLIPQELLLKMDSMKRELQILDSKTFAIIPPPQYSKFHGLIREAITRTHQACDAIYAYLKDSNPEDLQKIEDSLGKARELIRRTRTPES